MRRRGLGYEETAQQVLTQELADDTESKKLPGMCKIQRWIRRCCHVAGNPPPITRISHITHIVHIPHTRAGFVAKVEHKNTGRQTPSLLLNNGSTNHRTLVFCTVCNLRILERSMDLFLGWNVQRCIRCFLRALHHLCSHQISTWFPVSAHSYQTNANWHTLHFSLNLIGWNQS